MLVSKEEILEWRYPQFKDELNIRPHHNIKDARKFHKDRQNNNSQKYIYALRQKGTLNSFFYVGIAKDPKARFNTHFNSAYKYLKSNYDSVDPNRASKDEYLA
jgi:hypothetical protein